MGTAYIPDHTYILLYTSHLHIYLWYKSFQTGTHYCRPCTSTTYLYIIYIYLHVLQQRVSEYVVVLQRKKNRFAISSLPADSKRSLQYILQPRFFLYISVAITVYIGTIIIIRYTRLYFEEYLFLHKPNPELVWKVSSFFPNQKLMI